jgi:hypothetical protein
MQERTKPSLFRCNLRLKEQTESQVSPRNFHVNPQLQAEFRSLRLYAIDLESYRATTNGVRTRALDYRSRNLDGG